MTLNKNKTHILNGLIGDEKCFFAAPFVSDQANDALVDEVLEWSAEYAAGTLYATAPDNTTYKVDGLDQFPSPPKRNQ